ncbi:MAG: tryptophan 2,3-dioxygenase, partial [Planctomycetota bacterium]
TPINGVEHGDEKAAEKQETFIKSYLDAHAAEVEVSAEHAQALEGAGERSERIDAMYTKEKSAVAEFLRPADSSISAERVRARAAMIFIETYRDLPLLAWPRQVLAACIEFEQAFLIFRQRHARMVERVIGRRVGTGGSSGVDYLDQTALRYRVFRDLWAVRTMMIRPSATPPPESPDFYGFRSE